MSASHPAIETYNFLNEMYQDSYFPNPVVDKVKKVLLYMCEQIEETQPKTDAALLVLTHAATERINDLQQDFWDNESEIETAARDCIGMDFDFIVRTYGFDIDVEEVIATRDW